MTDGHTLEEMMDLLEEKYPEAHALDTQPDWIDSLVDTHDRIEIAYVRERGATPRPMIELEVMNSTTNETGWHRIEATETEWVYPFADPPAGVAAALEWLREQVNPIEFRQWWSDHQ